MKVAAAAAVLLVSTACGNEEPTVTVPEHVLDEAVAVAPDTPLEDDEAEQSAPNGRQLTDPHLEGLLSIGGERFAVFIHDYGRFELVSLRDGMRFADDWPLALFEDYGN